MQPQRDNKILSSFKLYLENKILSKGLAYTNNSSQFYKTPSERYYGYYTYSLPFQPLVSDASISGATIMTGIYLGNTFITKGQSGLHDINYEKGQVYFSGEVSGPLSGSYAVADYNIGFANKNDAQLLFETKQFLRPKVGQFVTGLNNNEYTYPSIYLKYKNTRNDPFALGGLDRTRNDVRATILADSQYLLDATLSIIRDLKLDFVPIIEYSSFPFNGFGGYVSGGYNYTGMTNGYPKAVCIEEVYASEFYQTEQNSLDNYNKDIFVAFVDFELTEHRFPRI